MVPPRDLDGMASYPGPDLQSFAVKAFSAFSTVQLLARFINPAKRGDVRSLSGLIYIIQTPQGDKHVLTILDIYLNQLNPLLIPTSRDLDSGNSAALDNAERGLDSLWGLQSLINHVQRAGNAGNVKNVRPVALRLIPRWDDIGRWLLFAIGRSPPTYLGERSFKRTNSQYIACATWIIDAAMEIAPDVAQAAKSSMKMMDVIINMWLLKNREVDCTQISKALPGQHHPHFDGYFVSPFPDTVDVNDRSIGCSLLVFMNNVILNKDLKDRFMNRWIAHLSEIGIRGYTLDPYVLFAKTLTSRIEQVFQSNEDRVCALTYSWKNLVAIGTMIKFLSNHPHACEQHSMPSDDENQPSYKIEEALSKANYVHRFTRTLLSISDRSFEDESAIGFPPRPTGDYALTLLCLNYENDLIFKHIFYTQRHLIDKLRGMIGPGLVKLAANAALTLERYTEEYKKTFPCDFGTLAGTFVRAIGIYGVAFPNICRDALKANELVTPEGWKALNWAVQLSCLPVGSTMPLQDIDWVKDFRDQLLRWDTRHTKYMKHWSQDVCDNANHLAQSAQREQAWGDYSKECAGCTTTVYCSKECQREDWETRHRDECRSLRRFAADLKRDAMCYRPRHRSWHINFIKEAYIECEGYRTHLSSHPSTIARIYAAEFPLRPIYFPADKYLPAEFCVVSSLDERASRDFVGWAKTRPAFESLRGVEGPAKGAFCMTRVVEGIFSYGERVILVTLKLWIYYHGSDGNEVDIVVWDSITRIGPLSKISASNIA
ncbi:hypothetical protein BKA70DRAFT_1405217 [Coprinopsis sp. MPI-PUGE-AT-0042]|nr:hypothetical protein BKA70DRAFT_1405217 [Coprinopsis sp. MPI-PUGE-AT-0042]